MIVGENSTEEMDCMFASLVDGFPIPPPPIHQPDSRSSKVALVDPNPIITPSNTEKTPDDLSAYMLRYLLEFMVSQVILLFRYATNSEVLRRIEQRG